MFKFIIVLLAALFAVSTASPFPLPGPVPDPRPVADPKPTPQFYTPYVYSGGYYAYPYPYPYAYYG